MSKWWIGNDDRDPLERPKATRCPCGGAVHLEQSIGFLVCKECCELLFVNELVPEGVQDTRYVVE